MSDDLVVVQTFTDEISAHIARTTLEAARIDSILRRDDAGGLGVGLPFSNRVSLVVRREDAEEAVRVLNETEPETES